MIVVVAVVVVAAEEKEGGWREYYSFFLTFHLGNWPSVGRKDLKNGMPFPMVHEIRGMLKPVGLVTFHIS
jgi:hypothetical protein